MSFNGEQFGSDMVAIVRRFVERAVEPLAKANAELAARNDALVARVVELESRDGMAELMLQIDELAQSVGALPDAPDLTGFATKSELAEVRETIPAIPDGPDLSWFALKTDLNEVRAAIPELPEPVDLSEYATKAELAAIEIPEAINGVDADPAAAAAIVLDMIEDRLAENEKRISDRLAEVKDGAPGMLPMVTEWEDGVHYAGAVVTSCGSLWQATKDTGREPPHADWICLASAGENGLTPEFVGTHEKDGEYRRLDVVAMNGGSFVALRDNPGDCPGDGWQLMASRGKSGQAIKGDKGDKGDKGEDATEIVSARRDDDVIVLTYADGREVRA